MHGLQQIYRYILSSTLTKWYGSAMVYEHQLCIATIKLWYKIAKKSRNCEYLPTTAEATVTYTAPTQILAFLTYTVVIIILIQIRILLRLLKKNFELLLPNDVAPGFHSQRPQPWFHLTFTRVTSLHF